MSKVTTRGPRPVNPDGGWIPEPLGDTDRYDRYDCCGMFKSMNIDHDELLTIESDPAAVMELVLRASTWEECDWGDQGYMAPVFFQEFARNHNWGDPPRVVGFFLNAYEIWQDHRNARVGGDAIAAMRDTIASYDNDRR